MKVKDLIIELQKHDPEALVVTDGYEMGLNDLRLVTTKIVFKQGNRPFWHGRYDESKTGEYTVKDAEPINAVYLPRLDHDEAVDE